MSMKASDIATELRRYVDGAPTITATELARALRYKNAHEMKLLYLAPDPDSAVPEVAAINGTRYMIRDVAVRLKEHMEVVQ